MSPRGQRDWVLSIDFGTTTTAGAVRVNGDCELVEIDNAPRMPSMVCWKKAENGSPGRLLIGDEAENEAAFVPECVERAPKRKLSQDFILLGSETLRVTDIVGQIFHRVIEEALPRQGGRPPHELRLTHPARWGEKRLAKLRQSARSAGYDDPLLVPEPVGAAVYFADQELRVGDLVAVYDLGGGTFDTAVLERSPDGFTVVGKPGGLDDLGGEDFDELLYRHLRDAFDPEQWQTLTSPDAETVWLRAHYDFRRDVRRAKELLSRRPDAKVRAPIPGTADLQVTASEFEQLIDGHVARTIEELERTIDKAVGRSIEELSAVYLAGGSSRIPLVMRRLQERFGKPGVMLGDPKGVIALGATRATVQPTHVPPSPAPGPGEVPASLTPEPPEPVTPKPPAAPTPSRTGTSTRPNVPQSIGTALAFAGAAMVIGSMFLHWFGTTTAWTNDFIPTRYPVILSTLAALSVGSILVGLRSGRRSLLSLSSLAGGFIVGAGFNLGFNNYRLLEAGFWLCPAGGLLIAVGALYAADYSLKPGDPKRVLNPGVAIVLAAASLVVVIGTLLLPDDPSGSTWSGVTPTRLPVVVTLLAAIGIALLLYERSHQQWRFIELVAILSAFLLAEIFPLLQMTFAPMRYGFWLSTAGAVAALVFAGGFASRAAGVKRAR